MSDHPYFRSPRPSIPTLSMEEGLTKLASAIEAEYRGAGLHSLTRFGKTRLGEWIVNDPRWLGRKYYGFLVTIAKDPKVGSNAFYEYILDALQVQFSSKDTPTKKLARLVNVQITRANAIGTRLIICVLDEANRLPGEEFEHLVTIDNALSKFGYTLFVVSLFQDNHTSGRAEAINKLSVTPQVKARFLNRYHLMHGIRGPEDIRVFWQRLEEETEHPPGSGISYPRHLAPELYERNFRLWPSAARLWERGRLALDAATRLDLAEWPMKPFELMTFYLVTRVLPRPGLVDITDDDLDEAIAFSDLIKFDSMSGTVEES